MRKWERMRERRRNSTIEWETSWQVIIMSSAKWNISWTGASNFEREWHEKDRPEEFDKKLDARKRMTYIESAVIRINWLYLPIGAENQPISLMKWRRRRGGGKAGLATVFWNSNNFLRNDMCWMNIACRIVKYCVFAIWKYISMYCLLKFFNRKVAIMIPSAP